jgi:hypothetical protein
MTKIKSSPVNMKKKLDKLTNKVSTEALEELHKVFLSSIERKKLYEHSEEFTKDNLEYDLRSTDWIVEKAKASEVYRQNIYAALCNNEFQKQDVWPIIQNKTWTCSWRYAGGIVADMIEEGDYLDYYCTGIRHDETEDKNKGFVGEGYVTDEVREDFKRLGWQITPYKD